MDGEKRRRNKKSYYKAFVKAKALDARNVLSTSDRGFLLTHNVKGFQCIREACNILNEFADNIFVKDEEVDRVQASVEDELESELTALRNESSGDKNCSRRFQAVKTGVNNVEFIKTTLPIFQIIRLHDEIFESAISGVKQSRFILRCLPVQRCAKAELTEIQNVLKECIQDYLESHLTSQLVFTVITKVRNNNSLDKYEITLACKELVKCMVPLCSYVYSNANLTILIDVCKKVACITLTDNYEFFSKCNLVEASHKVDKSDCVASDRKVDEAVVQSLLHDTVSKVVAKIEYALPRQCLLEIKL